MKITTAHCVAEINKQKAGKWKRISKRDGQDDAIIRVFEAADQPDVSATVAEKDGELAVAFSDKVPA